MAQSILSYGLTRSYPYPSWFTWLVVLVGVVATALFSVLNVAANGYELVTEYVADVNKTENPASPAWYQKRPWSLASRADISCQDQVFEVGSQFYTNNTNLQYSITNLATVNQTKPHPRPSLTYHNDILRNCVLQELIMERPQGRKYEQLQARVNCTTYDSQSRVPVALSLFYTYTADASTLGIFSRFLLNQPRPDSAVASWWGALVLYQASGGGCLPLALSIDNSVNYSDTTFVSEFFPGSEYQNTISFQNPRNIISQTPRQSPLSISPVWVDEWCSTFGNDTLNSYRCLDKAHKNCSKVEDTDPTRLVTIFWESVAKIFYSFVLTDLGQSVESNILGNESTFVNFLNTTRHVFGTNVRAAAECSFDEYFVINNAHRKGDYLFNDTDPAKFYEWYGSPLPTVYPAVINTQYLCQVPKRKPIGTIIFNTIVADLVFLQAMWTIFSFIVTFITEKRDPQANYCLGCTRIMADYPYSKDKTVSVFI